MKNSKFILFLTIVFINLLLVTGAVFSQGEWIVSEIPPDIVGVQVAKGQYNGTNNPDITWIANGDGILQTTFFDHDPKCNEEAGYVGIDAAIYPVPTAYFRPEGTCTDPVDSLYASHLWSVLNGQLIAGEHGDSSGSFVFNFATYTPSPTATATPTAPVTPTPTPTATPTPTNTPNTEEPPETVEPTQCIEARAERQVDDSYLIYVEAINPTGYTFYDGSVYHYSEEQPLAVSTLETGIVYTVSVGTNGEQCSFQLEPTGLPTEQQPRQLDFQLVIPFVSR